MMLDKKFCIQKTLGHGGSSKVFLGQDHLHNKYAIKILRKDKGYSYEHGANMIMNEHMLLQKFDHHPNILKSYQVSLEGTLEKDGVVEKDIMYNVLEFAEHGSLSFFIRTTGPLEEEITRFQFLQIAHASEFIHNQSYAHLDLKLENILLDKYFNVKVADLGAAVFLAKSKGKTYYRRGTILYMAPEVLDLKSGETFDAQMADIYSLGIWLYVMLVGEFPNPRKSVNWAITNDTEKSSVDDPEIEHADYISESRWSLLSKEVRDLILRMISVDPSSRPNISEVLEHSWLSRPFEPGTQYLVYSEMDARKEYIISTYQKKTSSS